MDKLLDKLATRPFRSKFHLSKTDKEYIAKRDLPTIREHAKDLISKRLAPAKPKKDGKQTPYKGHPVFVAQHATATCCRSCLQNWHKIPKDIELTADDQAYVVDFICRWIMRELEVNSENQQGS